MYFPPSSLQNRRIGGYRDESDRRSYTILCALVPKEPLLATWLVIISPQKITEVCCDLISHSTIYLFSIKCEISKFFFSLINFVQLSILFVINQFVCNKVIQCSNGAVITEMC